LKAKKAWGVLGAIRRLFNHLGHCRYIRKRAQKGKITERGGDLISKRKKSKPHSQSRRKPNIFRKNGGARGGGEVSDQFKRDQKTRHQNVNKQTAVDRCNIGKRNVRELGWDGGNKRKKTHGGLSKQGELRNSVGA